MSRKTTRLEPYRVRRELHHRGTAMEEVKHKSKERILKNFQKTEESESGKKKQLGKIIDFVNRKQYDKYLASESEIKTLDGEIEETWADVRESREGGKSVGHSKE
jgi:high-affinity K+ transport system ATPase subunit B